MNRIDSVSVTPGFRDIDKISEIYTEAFPPEERKLTIQQILELTSFKPDVKAYYCGEKVIGLSVLADLGPFIYGIFLAISKAERCNGFGGEIFDKMVEDCGDKSLVFSIEDPSEECDNKEQRVRRDAFYQKHNCHYTGYDGTYPGGTSTFRLMCSDRLDDYSFIKEAISNISPLLTIVKS